MQKDSSGGKYVLAGYTIWMIILSVVYFVLIHAGDNKALPFVWLAIGLSGVAAIIIGIIKYRPAAWRGWAFLAAANLFFIGGDTYYKVSHYILNVTNPYPSFSDALYLMTYPLFAAGAYIFIKHRSPAKSDRGAIIDAATFTIGLLLLVWVYLVIPNATVSDTALAARMTSVAYPLGDVLVWAMLVRLLVIDVRTRSVQLLALGASGLIVADIIYGLGQFYGWWHEGSFVDIGWIVFYASWGAAALHPSMKLIDTPISKLPPIRTRRLVLLAATALIAPALLLVETARGNASRVASVVAVFAAILFILVVLRMFTLLREISSRDAEIALEKQKNEVIEIVSHQLRTPLSIIMLYTEELLGTVTDANRKDVTTIKQANQRLIELVNALLYSTQLDMGTKDFELTPQDLGGMVSEAVKDTKSLLDEKQVTVEITTEPNMAPVTTDHEALKTAISYLVNNAARYGQDSANNRISITVKHEGGKGVVTVRDSGVGIPDEDQSKIFTRLFRANNAVTSFPDGVGLGLYVAKTIVERMGGHIGFNSKLGEGSAFYISLPLDNTPRAKAIAEPDGSVI